MPQGDFLHVGRAALGATADEHGKVSYVMSFDYSPWASPPAPSAVKELRAQARDRGVAPEGDALGRGASEGGMIAGAGALIVGGLGAILSLVFLANGGGVLAMIGIVVLGLLALLGVFLILRALPRYSRRWALYYQAVEFARLNRLQFIVQRDAPDYDSMPFRRQTLTRTTLYVYSHDTPARFEAGQLRNTVGNPDDTDTAEWGYIVVEREEAVAARVLVRSNSSENDSIVGPGRAALAGPTSRLNEEFTLFCPPESQAVARSVFTAELLDRLTALERHSGPLNIELIAERLYVTATQPFDMYDGTTVRLVFDTIAAAVPATADPRAPG